MSTSDAAAIQPISLQRPSQMVAAELRQRILRGEWHEDAPLPPASILAQRLGISRHHLREALRLLEHDGLIRIERGPTGGISLAIPDEDAVSRILEGILARYGTPLTDMNTARGVIEASIAGYAATEATPDDVAKLEAIVDREEADGWWHSACEEFHIALAHATHNQPLIVIAEAAWPVGKCRTEQFPEKLEAIRRKPAIGKQAIQAHRDLLRAITAHDTVTATALMRQHHDAMFAHFEPFLRDLRIGAKTDLI